MQNTKLDVRDSDRTADLARTLVLWTPWIRSLSVQNMYYYPIWRFRGVFIIPNSEDDYKLSITRIGAKFVSHHMRLFVNYPALSYGEIPFHQQVLSSHAVGSVVNSLPASESQRWKNPSKKCKKQSLAHPSSFFQHPMLWFGGWSLCTTLFRPTV